MGEQNLSTTSWILIAVAGGLALLVGGTAFGRYAIPKKKDEKKPEGASAAA